jgi:hypothetical protein
MNKPPQEMALDIAHGPLRFSCTSPPAIAYSVVRSLQASDIVA